MLRSATTKNLAGALVAQLLAACSASPVASATPEPDDALDGATLASDATPSNDEVRIDDAAPSSTDASSSDSSFDAGLASDGGPPIDPPPPPCKRTVDVATTAQLHAAVTSVSAGDCIVLADGDYLFDVIDAKGTATAPIVIRAANRGKATVSKGALELQGAAYVTIEGLTYQSSQAVGLTDCDHCRLTRIAFRIAETGPISWITVRGGTGGFNRVDHNDIGPKSHAGNLIGIYGGSSIIQHTRIDHNLFHDVGPVNSNGWETIRVGLSSLASSSGYAVIEYNLFQSTQGDPEVISVKSSDDVVRYNTMRDSKGQFTLRHGNRTEVYGNFIFGGGLAGTGGIRVLGMDHKIFDNYIEGVSGAAITLEGGESEETSPPGVLHYRVHRAQVVFNTSIGNAGGIELGGGQPLEPIDCTIANNLVVASTGQAISDVGSIATTYLGNMVHPTGGATIGITVPATQVRSVDPLLVKVGERFGLSASSTAIDAALGSFPFVLDDVDGDLRIKPDVGADEFSSAPPIRKPLTAADVGPNSP